MRKPLVAGNWKMNLDLSRGRGLVQGICEGLQNAGPQAGRVEVAVCPPLLYLHAIAKTIDGTGVRLGAQDVYFEAQGAYTGEVSAPMLADIGVHFVIVGHSERRHTIGHLEDDWMINRKVRAAIAADLVPILCVGETLAQREVEQTLDVLTFQTTAGLSSVRLDSPGQLVIAYEPVWAIGTGRNATPEQAQDAHAHLRAQLRKLLPEHADGIRILYGGSVKPDNAAAIFAQPDVDGGLIGGASLKADSFLGIVEAALAAAG
jgi:triosephosphate isomerase